MALVFFGPRKLPQLSRSLGKNLAEFRRASEDFKRTWEREVALEDIQSEPESRSAELPEENSIMNTVVATPPADQIVARDDGQQTSTAGELSSATAETSAAATEAPRKHDWL
jgi:Sec-independent protein translocase protein TatA